MKFQGNQRVGEKILVTISFDEINTTVCHVIKSWEMELDMVLSLAKIKDIMPNRF